MSAHGQDTNKLLKYLGYIIIFAIVYQFLFSRTGLLFQQKIQESTGLSSTDYIPKTYSKDAVSFKNILDNITIFRSSSSSSTVLTTNDRINIKSGYYVTKVVDGDTVDIVGNGKEERVRLIGINSPESVDPRRPVECFGKEASIYMKGLASSQSVSLETDPTQDLYDRNGRLLAYIYLDNGTMLNAKMIQDGYAYEYTYDRPYKYQKEFKNFQIEAKNSFTGLWSKNTCNGVK
ncbi:MAG: micrococcal nuclease [Patescibacteria group bacterium]|nr:micrococcal nuclease [Patescibacteria group bacterium]